MGFLKLQRQALGAGSRLPACEQRTHVVGRDTSKQWMEMQTILTKTGSGALLPA